MTDYLFENPWPLALFLAGAAVVAALLFRVTRRNRDAMFAGGLFAAALLTFVLDRAIETPAEAISDELDRLASAAVRGDAETLVEALSLKFHASGADRESMAQLIRSEVSQTQLLAVSINGRSIDASEAAGTADFVAVIAGSRRGFDSAHYPIRLRVEFTRESERWRINRVVRFDIVGKREEIPLTRP